MRHWWLAQTAIAVVVASTVLHADSPLTSTDLASAYIDLPAVREARLGKRLTPAVLQFLLAAEPNDRKAAVVNALGWQSPGNAAAFLNGFAAAGGVATQDVKLAQLTASDRFVLGYMLALETYADPAALRPGALDVWGATPMQLLDLAATALPQDFAVQYVRALVEAQHAMQTSFCSAYIATARVIEKFPERRRNLRPAAVAAAQSYMNLYKSDCTSAPVRPPGSRTPAALNPEHDQIYALARLGDTIVAGTQAGIVVWHPDQQRPVSSRDEQICASLHVWRNAAWAGCYGRVVRWDGTSWKSYLQDPARSETAFDTVSGSSSELLVRNRADVWRYDPERDTFVTTALDLGPNPHDVILRRNGELWRIDYLKAVVGPKRTYPINSAEYAGSDPRELMEDPAGRLWVMDFEQGTFRLDESTGLFQREPGLDDKASAVAVDPVRGRVWFLHYTDGPLVRENGDVRRPVDLKNLQYMRDMLLDNRTGDLWVAGWTGLVRLREEKGRWMQDTWSVRPRIP